MDLIGVYQQHEAVVGAVLLEPMRGCPEGARCETRVDAQLERPVVVPVEADGGPPARGQAAALGDRGRDVARRREVVDQRIDLRREGLGAGLDSMVDGVEPRQQGHGRCERGAVLSVRAPEGEGVGQESIDARADAPLLAVIT